MSGASHAYENMNDPDTDMDDEEVAEQLISAQAGQVESTNSMGGPLTLSLVSRRNPQGVILATPFAATYRSIFLLEADNQALLPLLKHVNCSYLSTPGLAPSLRQLKQHAQSLAILIKHLSISTKPGVIDNAGRPGIDMSFAEGETYDWLNDLTKEYIGPLQNPAVAHRHEVPLNSVLNVLENFPTNATTRDGTPLVGVGDMCPLHHVTPAPNHGPSLPYATHQALISHANELLELLDHEYSATGGLLSILPSKEQEDDREKASSTLLGQLILHMQHLVERLHVLERQYANSLDVLSSESVAPHQALSRLGPSGRKGREIVYPQDRFILVNAGDDVWSHLDKEFAQKEEVDEALEKNYEDYGVMGAQAWAQRGGKEMARGITALDITTRYYRIRKDPLKTVFIIPAHQIHPGVKATRDMDKTPTVVSVVKPVWPERVSMWEAQHREDLDELKILRQQSFQMRDKLEILENEKKVLVYENKLKDGNLRDLKAKNTQLESLLNGDGIDKVRREVFDQLSSIQKQKREAITLVQEAKRLIAAAHAEKEEISVEAAKLEDEKRTWKSQKARVHQRLDKRAKQINEDLVRDDQNNARAALQTEAKLKELWKEQIIETQQLLEWLKIRKIDFENDVIPESGIAQGTAIGTGRFEEAFPE